MKYNFLRVATATPSIKVADCDYNIDQIIRMIQEAEQKESKLILFPELCITGYTCSDLFLQDVLIEKAKNGMLRIAEATKGMDQVVVVGLPFLQWNVLFNVAAVIQDGKILGIVPKHNIPNYSEFYEARHFVSGKKKVEYITVGQQTVPFGMNLIFECEQLPLFCLSVEICEDVWVPIPPSSYHALAGATVIVNPSASDETTGKVLYRKELISNQSARLIACYLYSDAGDGESTTDLVYAGHNLIYENGTMLSESSRFQMQNHIEYAELDLGKIQSERRRVHRFDDTYRKDYTIVTYQMKSLIGREKPVLSLTRTINKAPFVPSNFKEREKRCEEIFHIQAMGLKKRLQHANCKCAIIGISGGLDSTLALLVTVKAFELLGLDKKGIVAVTMPCFGTTDRTYNNAVQLTNKVGATLKEIKINEAVLLHLRDLEHDVHVHDVTYENAQARERTQILMNLANQYNGMVVGTGDMSELALGWATYNGDHMSMYGVNASVPKTLVRYLVDYYAHTTKSKTIKEVLSDILDTPVSPELLPPKDGVISQKTEDIVGPYELHDFVLYYVMRFGYAPSKIFYLAEQAFKGQYDKETILKWLKIFYRRFFSQQFKRSCLPDGPKVGSVAVSPRGDLRMPSDASAAMWLKEIEEIEI